MQDYTVVHMQDDTVVEIWLSKDSVGSKITPRSLTDWAGLMLLIISKHFCVGVKMKGEIIGEDAEEPGS